MSTASIHQEPVRAHPLTVENVSYTAGCGKTQRGAHSSAIPCVQNMNVQNTARMVLEGSTQQKCAILCFPYQGKL